MSRFKGVCNCIGGVFAYDSRLQFARMADLNSKVESSAFGRFWRSFNDLLTTTKVGGVAVNAFGELIRQPVFLLLFTFVFFFHCQAISGLAARRVARSISILRW